MADQPRHPESGQYQPHPAPVGGQRQLRNTPDALLQWGEESNEVLREQAAMADAEVLAALPPATNPTDNTQLGGPPQ